MHTCSRCDRSFDPMKARAKDISWRSIFYRPVKALPLSEDIEAYALVRCPFCGHSETAVELKVFGIFPGKSVKIFLWGLFLFVLLFGYWIVRT